MRCERASPINLGGPLGEISTATEGCCPARFVTEWRVRPGAEYRRGRITPTANHALLMWTPPPALWEIARRADVEALGPDQLGRARRLPGLAVGPVARNEAPHH